MTDTLSPVSVGDNWFVGGDVRGLEVMGAAPIVWALGRRSVLGPTIVGILELAAMGGSGGGVLGGGGVEGRGIVGGRLRSDELVPGLIRNLD